MNRLTPEQEAAVLDVALTEGKIAAIKRFRELTNGDLSEAKAAVDTLMAGAESAPPKLESGEAPRLESRGASMDAQLLELLKEGIPKKIAAIKRYRELTGVGLAEAKHEVEALLESQPWLNPAAPPPPINLQQKTASKQMSAELEVELTDMLRQGGKIPAIKRYREVFLVDLSEAKTAVEALGRKHGIQDKSGCFVATAVFEDGAAPEVKILRIWRDEQLAATTFGRWLIRKYYQIGPSLALIPRRHRVIRAGLRRILSWVSRRLANGA